MKPKVYLETTIPSLLTAWPSRDLVIAADQQSWNCRHIHNAMISRRLAEVCSAQGFTLPVVCTPRELMAI
jgi:hypothetical protein